MAVSKVVLNGSTLIDTTDKTVTAGSMLSGVTALKNDGTTATGSIATKTSSNLSVSGATVTAPAGYYASDASKSVASGTEGTPTATKSAVSNHSVTVTPSVTNTAGYISGGTHSGTAVIVTASELDSGTKSILENGTDIDVVGYATVDVAVETGPDCPIFTVAVNSDWTEVQSVTCDTTFSECNTYISNDITSAIVIVTDGENTREFGASTGNNNYNVLKYYYGDVVPWLEIDYQSNGTITGTFDPVPTRNGTDLTASGATVTAPAGYYSSAASKSVASGSATTPSTSISANPSISVNSSTGLITATTSASQSVTPTVSAGYVSSGTAGTITVSGSNTSQLTTQAAQTITPTTTAQTISSGKYLTGTQTIEAVVCENLTAANIADGVTVKIGTATDDDSIASVTGTHQGGGNLTTKTVTPGDDVQIINQDTELRTANYTELAAAHTVNSSPSYTYSVVPSQGLTANEEYALLGHIDVIDSNNNILESYAIDTTFIWSTTRTTIVENDENAYYSEIKFSKGGSATSAFIETKCQKAATYGFIAVLSIREISGYDGLSSVTVNPVKYSETLIKNWITRSSNFKDIEWPEGVTTIGSYAFANCGYFNPSSLPSTLQGINTYAFYNCSRLGLTNLPSSITSIGEYAFSGCTALGLTSLPSNITIISRNTFHSCSSLALQSLPNGVTAINPYAFQGCSNITLSSLPSGLTSLGDYAFYNCKKITISSIPSSITSKLLNSDVFYGCEGITSMTIPSGFTSIGSEFFRNCSNLASVTLPDTITSISSYAFGACESLLSIECNGAITSMTANAFGAGKDNCTMLLQSASFPNMVQTSNLSTVFGNFSNSTRACHYLEFVDIGKTAGIAGSSFANCYSLEIIVLRKTTVATLAATSAFTNTPFSGYDNKTGTAYVPSALIASYKTASNWSVLYNNGTVTFEAIEGSDYELD